MVEQRSGGVNAHGSVNRFRARKLLLATNSLKELMRIELQKLQVTED